MPARQPASNDASFGLARIEMTGLSRAGCCAVASMCTSEQHRAEPGQRDDRTGHRQSGRAELGRRCEPPAGPPHPPASASTNAAIHPTLGRTAEQPDRKHRCRLTVLGCCAVLSAQPPVDIVIACECIVPRLYPIEPLVQAIDALLGPAASGSVCFVAYEHRERLSDPRGDFKKFAETRGIEVVMVEYDEMDVSFRAPDIEIWRVTRL